MGNQGIGTLTASPATIHIIEDDTGLRDALVRLVRSVGYKAQAHDRVGGFLSAAPGAGPSCILLDVRLPDMSGLELQERLRDSGVRYPVVMMTGHADIPMSVRAMKAGALDFLTKPFREQDLLDALSRAVNCDALRMVEEERFAGIRTRFATLTAREREVLGHVVGGAMNKEIAEELSLSIVTVKAHRGSVMRKMGARSVTDLVRSAEALGIDAPEAALA